jgi:hypothetical protein
MFRLKQPLFFLIVFIVAFSSVHSQPAIDTISYSIKQKPTLIGHFGSRNSFVNNNRAQVLGIQIGLNFADNVSFGIGYNQLYSSSSIFDKKIFYQNNNNITNMTNANLQLTYFSAWAEYVYYRNHKWQFSIPFQIGIGQAYYKYTLNNELKKIDENVIFVYEPAVSVEYKITKWLGVGSDIGFRFILTNYNHLNEKLNSPTYAFNLLIYYSEIYKSLKKEKEKWKKNH